MGPIDLLLSCREDDVLMVPQLTQWCQDACDCEERKAKERAKQLELQEAKQAAGGSDSDSDSDDSSKANAAPPTDHGATVGLRRCTLLLTGKGPPLSSPLFAEGIGRENELDKLQSLPNAQVLRSRLALEHVSEAMSCMPMPMACHWGLDLALHDVTDHLPRECQCSRR